MTKARLIASVCVVVLALYLFSCNKSAGTDKCITYTKAPVTKIAGPTSGSVNQIIDVPISFGCFNGCGAFGNFEQSFTGDTTVVNVIAKYEGCICTQDAPTRQTVYKFKASQPGTYYVKFWQSEKTYLTDTIRIQ